MSCSGVDSTAAPSRAGSPRRHSEKGGEQRPSGQEESAVLRCRIRAGTPRSPKTPVLIANPTGTRASPDMSSLRSQCDRSNPGVVKRIIVAAKATGGKAPEMPLRGRQQDHRRCAREHNERIRRSQTSRAATPSRPSTWRPGLHRHPGTACGRAARAWDVSIGES